ALAGWMGYVGVDDVDACADRMKQQGGSVLVPPRDIHGVSRFAVVADQHMGMLALLKWLNPDRSQPPDPDSTGRVGWHELLAVDWEASWSFYSEVFGWQKAGTETGTLGTYQQFSAGGRTIGGMFTKPDIVAMPYWLYYFNVADIDSTVHVVKTEGGSIVNGP